MTTERRDIILVDSESDESFQMQRFSRRTTRTQKRKNSQTSRKQKSLRRHLSLVIDDDDDDDNSVIHNDSLHVRSEDLSEEACSDQIVRTAEKNSSERTVGTADSVSPARTSTSTNCQPRRTAKRGLAKKNPQPLVACSTLPSHHISVYSQAITEEFKSLLHGVNAAGGESVLNDTREGLQVKPETKDLAEAELLSINGNSDITGSKDIFSEQVQPDLIGEAGEKSLNSSIQIQSPSPPPQQPSLPRRVTHLNKKLSRALKTLNEAKNSLKTPPSKRCRRRDSDVIIVGEEDASVKKDISVKVRYLTKVYRIQMKLVEPFHVLVRKLGKEIGKAEHDLGLFLHDRSLEVSQTPRSVNLSVADIIECHCINVSENSAHSSDTIELVIQCRSSRRRTTVTANKRRPLSDVIRKYAQLMNEDSSCLTFSFDGEDIDPSDTPSKLEMEDHDVIDVVYS